MARKKTQREIIRWHVMVALNSARPIPATESLILWALQGCPIQCTAAELRRELHYLEGCKLVMLRQYIGPPWIAELTDRGVDMMQRAWEERRVGVMRAPGGTDAAIGRVVN